MSHLIKKSWTDSREHTRHLDSIPGGMTQIETEHLTGNWQQNLSVEVRGRRSKIDENVEVK